jgi:hypothetical protein
MGEENQGLDPGLFKPGKNQGLDPGLLTTVNYTSGHQWRRQSPHYCNKMWKSFSLTIIYSMHSKFV